MLTVVTESRHQPMTKWAGLSDMYVLFVVLIVIISAYISRYVSRAPRLRWKHGAMLVSRCVGTYYGCNLR